MTRTIPHHPSRDRSSRTRRGVLVVLSTLVLVAAVLAACSATDSGIVPDSVVGDGDTATDEPTDEPTEGGTDTTATPTADVPEADGQLPSGPEVVRWGGQGRQLSVVIRNQSDVMVKQANTEIEAIGSSGEVISTATGNASTTCCSVLGLVPGAQYGLFADLDVPVSEVASVRVTYLDPEVVEAATYPEPVTTRVLGVDHPAGDTVVRVDINVHEAASPYLVGQAFLVDAEGRLVGVISGRWYCVGPGTQRELRMQLLNPTPAATRVDRVVVHAVPQGVSPGVTYTCT